MLKKLFKFIFETLEKPMPFFLTFHLRPKRAEQVGLQADSLAVYPNIAIVLQGPLLKDENFTLETVKLYKKIFKNAIIIVSTWSDSEPALVEQIRSAGAEVLLNEKPSFGGYANINYQIVSSLAGVKKAREKGAEYVLKTRCDQRFYAPNSLEFLCNIIETFPVAEGYRQKKRIIGVSLNTFKYRRYGISDMTIFGSVDDMMLYWGAPPSVQKEGERINGCYKMAETYLSAEFLAAIGRPVSWTLEDSWKAFADHFCIVDQHSLDLYWYKYARMREYRYIKYKTMSNDQEFTFAEWLSLYSDMANKGPVDESKIQKLIP